MQHSKQLPECQKDIAHIKENIDLKLDAIITTLNQVKEQTTKTNGRVTKIEQHGAWVFWLGRNWVSVASVVGVLVAYLSLKK